MPKFSVSLGDALRVLQRLEAARARVGGGRRDAVRLLHPEQLLAACGRAARRGGASEHGLSELQRLAPGHTAPSLPPPPLGRG
jgi:hypothetical protein